MALKDDFKKIRHEYGKTQLLESEINTNPFIQFSSWLQHAIDKNIADANAMTLATCSLTGKPSARIVLLKKYDDQGFCFFTNYDSRKGIELKSNAYAAIVFFWPELERQIRIEGKVEKLPSNVSDKYFLERPLGSRIAASVSPQSKAIENRDYLNKIIRDFKSQTNKQIKRPVFWGGYRIIPELFEFWQGRENRLNDRIEYYLEKNEWKTRRLAP
ncbi:pyridoxamine 5'-phosphate oxidase [Marinifilum sp. RC60d5]|uniref:pyridoxamine 5'-phosphate oxidase n=1 Tax=Marinifilum sp. RC60d5 TaxID=3458414 RepID=UPI0040352FCC